MHKLPIVPLPKIVNPHVESYYQAQHIMVLLTANVDSAATVEQENALLADLIGKIHEILTADHFLPFSERLSFFDRMPLDVFGNELENRTAIETGVCNAVFERVQNAYQQFAQERQSYWIAHAAISQRYNKQQWAELPPIETSHFGDVAWQNLMHAALVNDDVDAVERIFHWNGQFSYEIALVTALNVNAHNALQYILPHIPMNTANSGHMLHLCGFSQNTDAFEYLCNKIEAENYSKVRDHLCSQATPQLVELFDHTVAQQQRQRLIDNIASGTRTAARKI